MLLIFGLALLLFIFIGFIALDSHRSRRRGEVSRQGEAETDVRVDRPRRSKTLSRTWAERGPGAEDPLADLVNPGLPNPPETR